ncbi:ABC transporter permease [Treponema denticola]|uniref:ABC transporter permease n=1 Tax=Treponema denticola TaxID=158 RepID=UPI002107ABEA|nr:ABC transporter permease [Treponema denticola]UTY25855.1 ABC transporter permease [Treponema denticola]
MSTCEEPWDLIIEPKRKLLDIPIREVIRYRDLIALFIKRDFVTQYKQTILGPLWFIINPLISTVMYAFVFGNLAKLSTDGVPHILFYYAGTMLWSFFAGCFTDATNIFVNNASLFGKVYFPRLTVPISNIASNVTRILVQFLCLMGFFVYYVVTSNVLRPSLLALLFPLILIWIAAVATGMGMVISALTTKYKDLRLLVNFALNLAMYATAVVYPVSQIPQRFHWVLYANPMNAPIELFRAWFYGAGGIQVQAIISSILLTFFLLFLGLIMFNQNERNFIDVV